MKKTISILTIIALIAAPGCTAKEKNANTENTTFGQQADSTVTKAVADESAVKHPASDIVADFEKQIASGIVILDFFAQWCPPCKKFGPIFVKTAGQAANANKLFFKIDVEQFTNLTNMFGVRSMPTIIAIKDGKEVKRHVGGMSEPQFIKWLNDIK